MKTRVRAINEGDAKRADVATRAAMRELSEVTELATDLWSERSLLYVLASVGTQMAAFVHEINALLGAAQTIEQAEAPAQKGRAVSRTAEEP